MVKLHLALCAHDDGHECVVSSAVILPPQLITILVAVEIFRLGPMTGPENLSGRNHTHRI